MAGVENEPPAVRDRPLQGSRRDQVPLMPAKASGRSGSGVAFGTRAASRSGPLSLAHAAVPLSLSRDDRHGPSGPGGSAAARAAREEQKTVGDEQTRADAGHSLMLYTVSAGRLGREGPGRQFSCAAAGLLWILSPGPLHHASLHNSSLHTASLHTESIHSACRFVPCRCTARRSAPRCPA